MVHQHQHMVSMWVILFELAVKFQKLECLLLYYDGFYPGCSKQLLETCAKTRNCIVHKEMMKAVKTESAVSRNHEKPMKASLHCLHQKCLWCGLLVVKNLNTC